MLLGEFKLMFATIVNIAKLPVINEPFKSFDITNTITKLKYHMQIVAYNSKFAKDRISVIFVEIRKIVNENRIV